MFIQEDLYKEIVKNIPICCVDIVLIHDNKLFLVKRNQEPVKNEWWFVGGRIWFGEDVKESAIRKVKEELNLTINKDKLQFVNVFSTIFPIGAYGEKSHTINVTYKYVCDDITNVKFDSTISKTKLFKFNHKSLHEYIKNVTNQAKGLQ